jgi:hypothetical protein
MEAVSCCLAAGAEVQDTAIAKKTNAAMIFKFLFIM